MNGENKFLLPFDIRTKIYFIRGMRVMLDSDLATLYGVETKYLNKMVRRNITRFPSDFMFEADETALTNISQNQTISNSYKLEVPIWNLKFQKSGHGGRRNRSLVFTEQGIAMLSGILRSERAVNVNIEIMRAFVKMRALIENHKELAEKIHELEKKYNHQFKMVFDAINEIITPSLPEKRRKIGFDSGDQD